MQAKNWKLGVSTCSWDHSPETLLDREMFKAYKEGGIDCLEISMRWCYYDQIDYKKAGKLSKEYGVDIWSFHLPFQPFAKTNPCSIDKEIRDISFNRFSDFIRIGADVGAKVFVVHPSGEDTPPEQREEHLKCGQEFFAGLGAVDNKIKRTVFVVGDRKQSIYGFRFAQMENLEVLHKYIEEKYHQNFPEIKLETNYRSTSHVLNVVNHVTEEHLQLNEALNSCEKNIINEESCSNEDKDILKNKVIPNHLKLCNILAASTTTYRYFAEYDRNGNMKNKSISFVNDEESPNIQELFPIFEVCYSSIIYISSILDYLFPTEQ